MYSIWVESSSNQLTEIKKVIKTLSEEEDKDYFEPHVTLVTNLNSEHSAMDVFNKIPKKRFDITFYTIQEGTTYFQRLFLTSTDNTNFQNSIIDIEGWPVYGFLIYHFITGTSYQNLILRRILIISFPQPLRLIH